MAKKQDGVKEIFLPVDYRNRRRTHVPVCLNGVWYQVKRGEAVSVPAGVAEILENALSQEEAAYQIRSAEIAREKGRG